MGRRISQFDVPVCDSFQTKILNDQLCYTVDPNKFKEETLENSLTFYVDTNIDRQYPNKVQLDEHNKKEFTIYLDTLGKIS